MDQSASLIWWYSISLSVLLMFMLSKEPGFLGKFQTITDKYHVRHDYNDNYIAFILNNKSLSIASFISLTLNHINRAGDRELFFTENSPTNRHWMVVPGSSTISILR